MKCTIGFLTIFLFAFATAPAMADPVGRDMGCSPTVANPCTGGNSSGGSSGPDPAAAAIGQALGHALGEALFGSPETEAKQKAENEARESARRRAEEQELKRHEEMKSRLMGNMMGVGGDSSQLGLMGVDSGSGLGLMTDDLQVKETKGAFGSTEIKPAGIASPSGDQGAPHTDTSVVDARNVPSGLPKSVDDAIPRTPSGDRVRKGFQAIQAGDWQAALAWFQDARNLEPGNPGLGRLVELAQFTLEYRTRAQTPMIENTHAPVQTIQSPNQNSATKSTVGTAAGTGDPAVKLGDNSIARVAAGQMAARARADAAYKQYSEKYGDHYSPARTRAVSKAYRGEGYTDEELKAQLQKSLLEYRKNYRKNHPSGPDDSVGGTPAADEIILGGKG